MATITDTYASVADLTISLGSLGTSTTVGRISTFVDNTSNKYLSANVYVKLTTGATNPTANTPFYVYLARSDNSGSVNDDGNGTTNAAGTFINTPLLGVMNCNVATGSSTFWGVFDTSNLGPLGPAWGIGIVNNCGGSLNPTSGSSFINYIGITKTVA